jgi:hypothetical protein
MGIIIYGKIMCVGNYDVMTFGSINPPNDSERAQQKCVEKMGKTNY